MSFPTFGQPEPLFPCAVARFKGLNNAEEPTPVSRLAWNEQKRKLGGELGRWLTKGLVEPPTDRHRGERTSADRSQSAKEIFSRLRRKNRRTIWCLRSWPAPAV